MTDSAGLTDTASTTITVLHVDQPPVVPALSGHVALVGQPFALTIPATDADPHAVLTFSATGLPLGASIDPHSGVLTWTPTPLQAGEADVTISVSAGTSSTSQSLVLIASSQPIPPHVLVTLTPSFPPVAGQSVFVNVSASGIANIQSLGLTLNGKAVTLDQFGRFTFTPPTPGHYALVATAIDVDGVQGTTTADLKVRDPNNKTAPVVTIDSPLGGDILTGPTFVLGGVASSNLDTYTLTLTPLGGSDTMVLASGSAAVADGTSLATIDTNRLANGAYSLVLTATDIAGRTTTVTRVLDVDTVAKSEAFATAATDLTVTLDGVVVPLTRFYSTVNANEQGLLWLRVDAGRGRPADHDKRPTENAGKEADGVYNPAPAGHASFI